MAARGEDVVSGTTTTGTTSPLALAAIPAGASGVDFVAAFGTSGLRTVPYCLIEFTDSTFATISKVETGVGVLTLAGTIGSATLARSRLVSTLSGGTYSSTPTTAISIGTAANCLVFIPAQASSSLITLDHVITTSAGGDNIDAYPSLAVIGQVNTNTHGRGYCDLFPYYTTIPASIKRASLLVTTGGGAGSLTRVGLYEVHPDGHTMDLVLDFGAFDTSAAANVSRLSASGHFTETFLAPGAYVMATIAGNGTGTTDPITRAANTPTGLCNLGTSGGSPLARFRMGDGARPATSFPATFDLNSPPANFSFVNTQTFSNGQSVPQLMLGHS